MTISIGTNLFGSNNRQDLCIESLLKLKKEFKSEINLYNIQFKNKYNFTTNNNLHTLTNLVQKSEDYISDSNNPYLPIVSELFDTLADTDCEYFIYTNNDIIISNRLIYEIKKTKRDCYPVSRLAIHPILSLQDPIKYSHYQVAGFDVFAVNTLWWKLNRDKFPPYILGFPAWDVHYATNMMMHSNNSTLLNKWPPHSFHIIHDSPWKADKHIPERVWNENIFWKKHKFDVCKIWNKYLYEVLLKRSNEYRTPLENELELEKKYFKNYNE